MTSLRQMLSDAREALRCAGLASAQADAELLLRHVLGRDRAYFHAHPEEAPEPDAARRYRALVQARAAGTPVQYLTGEQEFFGRAFSVTPAVLIPRPETELVVQAALEAMGAIAAMAGRQLEPLRGVDVGTGSGCIAVTLALERPGARVLGVERSAAALVVARANARRWRATVTLVQGDLLAPFAAGAAAPFDLVVANPPYVATGELATLAPEVRDYEPREALVSGPSGIEAYERLLPQAWDRLRPGGWLILEIGYRAGEAVRRLLRRWSQVETRRDWQGWERVVLARRP